MQEICYKRKINIYKYRLKVGEAIKAVQKKVEQAGNGTYRVRIIHGYRGGTRIRTAIREEFSYGREPKVKRVVMGDNEGITELILKELF